MTPLPEEVAATIRRATLIAITSAPRVLAEMPEFREQVRREVDRLMRARLASDR